MKYLTTIISFIAFFFFSTTDLEAAQIYHPDGTPSATPIVDQPYGFTGRRYDSESGFYCFRARYYSSELGRFISRDPIGHADGMNLYGGYFAERFGLDPSGKKATKYTGSGTVHDVTDAQMAKRQKQSKGTNGETTHSDTFKAVVEEVDGCCHLRISGKLTIDVYYNNKYDKNKARANRKTGNNSTVQHEKKHIQNVKENWNSFIEAANALDGMKVTCKCKKKLEDLMKSAHYSFLANTAYLDEVWEYKEYKTSKADMKTAKKVSDMATKNVGIYQKIYARCVKGS